MKKVTGKIEGLRRGKKKKREGAISLQRKKDERKGEEMRIEK